MTTPSWIKSWEKEEIFTLLLAFFFPWIREQFGKGKVSKDVMNVGSITSMIGGWGSKDEDLLLYLFTRVNNKPGARKVLLELRQKLTPTAIRGLRLRLTSLPGDMSSTEDKSLGENGIKRDARLTTLEGLITLCENEGIDETVKLLTEYGIIVRDPLAIKWIKKICNIEDDKDLAMGDFLDKLKPGIDRIKDWVVKLEKDDPTPIPMGPIRYIINSVLIGGDKAELVLIPLWIKNLKWPSWPKSEPRRGPLEYHERKPPTL